MLFQKYNNKPQHREVYHEKKTSDARYGSKRRIRYQKVDSAKIECDIVYTYRIADRDCNHRDSGGNAPAGTEQGETDGEHHQLSEPAETDHTGIHLLCQ